MRSFCMCVVLLFVAVVAQGQDEDYTLTLSNALCDDTGTIEVTLTLDFADGEALQGYQWGVCHDEDVLELESDADVEPGAALDGLSYTFEAIYTYDEAGASGWATGALFNVITGVTLDPQDDAELYVVTYECLETEEEETTIELCGTLGVPLIAVRLIVDAEEVEPVTVDGVVTLVQPVEFLRGDVDSNGVVSALLDSLFLLRWAFQGDDEPTCEDAADVNDSGSVQAIVDSLRLLQWAFQDGAEPPSPGPDDCGAEITDEDDLECDVTSDECA